MIPFQIIAVPLLFSLAARAVYGAVRSGMGRRTALLSAFIWLGAAACILRPDLMTAIATRLGIGRGADLVLYVFCLGVLVLAFLGKVRMDGINSDLTTVVRHLALNNPRGESQQCTLLPKGQAENFFPGLEDKDSSTSPSH